MLTVSDDPQIEQKGLHIYTGGVALQQFFILCFISLALRFHHQLLSGRNVLDIKLLNAKKLLYVLYTSLGLITVRFHLPPPRPPAPSVRL